MSGMSLVLATKVSVGVACFTICVEVVILFFSTRELWRWRRLPPDSPNSVSMYLSKRSVLMIALASFFSIFNGVGYGWLNLVGLAGFDSSLCVDVIPRFYTLAYCFAQLCIYEFLRTRYLLVESPAEDSRLFWGLRFFTTAAIRIGFLVFPLWIILSWVGVVVPVNGVNFCVDGDNLAIGMAYTVIAFPLQCTFLFLFIAPLWQHANEMRKFASNNSKVTAASDSIVRVIRRNFILSTISIISIMFTTVFAVVVATSDPADAYLSTYSVCYSNFDLMLALCCLCMMTYQWLPPHLRPKVQEESKATITAVHSSPALQPVPVNGQENQVPSLVLQSPSPSISISEGIKP